MRTLKQPKKAYQAPYIQCFHHIKAEQILSGSPPSGSATNPGTDDDEESKPGNGDLGFTKQSFFYDEEEEDGYYW